MMSVVVTMICRVSCVSRFKCKLSANDTAPRRPCHTHTPTVKLKCAVLRDECRWGKWINQQSLWGMASATPDSHLPTQSLGITVPWPVPNYTSWWWCHADLGMHTPTHTRFMAIVRDYPGEPGKKVKPIWILLEQETASGTRISWAICKSTQRSRQITTPAPHHSVFYRPDALPAAQPTASKHWRHTPTVKVKYVGFSRVLQSLKTIQACIKFWNWLLVLKSIAFWSVWSWKINLASTLVAMHLLLVSYNNLPTAKCCNLYFCVTRALQHYINQAPWRHTQKKDRRCAKLCRNNTNGSCSLTTEPHAELHLGCDLVFAEMVCQVWQWVDVCSSAYQHQYLMTHNKQNNQRYQWPSG